MQWHLSPKQPTLWSVLRQQVPPLAPWHRISRTSSPFHPLLQGCNPTIFKHFKYAHSSWPTRQADTGCKHAYLKIPSVLRANCSKIKTTHSSSTIHLISSKKWWLQTPFLALSIPLGHALCHRHTLNGSTNWIKLTPLVLPTLKPICSNILIHINK